MQALLSERVQVGVYTVAGKFVGTPMSMQADAGMRRFVWNAQDMAPGVYIVRAVTMAGTMAVKIIL